MKTVTYIPILSPAENKLFKLALKISSGSSTTEKLILCILINYSYNKSSTFIGQEKLSQLCGCSIRTVQRALLNLESKGLIVVVQAGKFKKYFFTLPEKFKHLAIQYGLVVTDDKLSSVEPSEPQITKESNDNLSSHDNLSTIYKSKNKNINNPPIVPPRSFDINPPTGGGAISSLSKKEKIQQDFQTLWAAYPCKKEERTAFEAFKRLYSSLPPVSELLQLVEHEKQHNLKWQKENGRYVTWLHNWLRCGWQEVQEFVQIQESRKFLVSPLSSSATVVAPAAEPEQTWSELPARPYIETEFFQASQLWPASKIAVIAAKNIWMHLCERGIQPTLKAAKQARRQFSSLSEWLVAFGKNQDVQNRVPA